MALVLGRKDLQKDLVHEIHQAQIRFKENNKYEKEFEESGPGVEDCGRT
jgi:hypothetical protein